MRRSKGGDKPAKDEQESPGGRAMERLHQLERERGLPETHAEPGAMKPKDGD
jgi:hypothetical protein